MNSDAPVAEAPGKPKHWSRGSSDGESVPAEQILLYYLYIELEDVESILHEQALWCELLGLKGRVRVATEGLNGTLDGSKAAIVEYRRRMDNLFGEATIHWKLADYPHDCIKRFKGLSVKLCKEVISTDLDEESRRSVLAAGPGRHLSPKEFHAELINPDPNLVLIDTRNFYEVRIGKFEPNINNTKNDDIENGTGAATEAEKMVIDPFTRSFSDLRRWVESSGKESLKNKKVLMYCTGGVRCERASALIKAMVPDTLGVFQLHGGIHAYLEEYGESDESRFKGKMFVYDPRVATPATARHVVGKCLVCSDPWDDYSFQMRCGKCRVLVLVCDPCRLKSEERDGEAAVVVCEQCLERDGATTSGKEH